MATWSANGPGGQVSLHAAGVERQVIREGDGARERGRSPDHGRVVRAQLGGRDDETEATTVALLSQGATQEPVGGDAPGGDDRGGVVRVGGAQELAGEGLDHGRLVAGGKVWQLFARPVLV